MLILYLIFYCLFFIANSLFNYLPNLASRESTSKHIMEETGASFIHPYNMPDVMSGQGTIALEFLDQVQDLDAIVVPIGGGGMTSGIAMAIKSINPSITIIAAEPGNFLSIYLSNYLSNICV